MITFKQGDIFDPRHDVIVSTVNSVGICGKGLALAVKQKYPEIMKSYIYDCKNDRIGPGDVVSYKMNDGKIVLACATKKHWKDPSKYEWIFYNLMSLKEILSEKVHLCIGREIESFGMVFLGCSNGGLDKNIVKPLIMEFLGEIDKEIIVYE